MIILDPIVALTYIKAHSAASLFINKPIENYEGLKIIRGEDSARGSYMTSLFYEFKEKSKNEDNNNNENVESTQVVNVSDTMVTSILPLQLLVARRRHQGRGPNGQAKRLKNLSMMGDLITIVGEMTAAIKKPNTLDEDLVSQGDGSGGIQ
ncbi:hypothetical protein DsansV1_C13g0117101 [Dioscorea sansibarensis]